MLRLWGVPLPPWLPSLSSLDPPNKYLEPALSQGGPSTLATPTENSRDFALPLTIYCMYGHVNKHKHIMNPYHERMGLNFWIP